GRAPAALATPVEIPMRGVADQATIRILTIAPLRFEVLDPARRGQERQTRFEWSLLAVTPHAAAKLVKLRFGDIARIRYVPPAPQIHDPVEYAPIVMTDVKPGDTPAPAALRLADWLPDDGREITIYADGHAFVELPDENVEVTLTAAELRTFLGSFAAARFDELPSDDRGP